MNHNSIQNKDTWKCMSRSYSKRNFFGTSVQGKKDTPSFLDTSRWPRTLLTEGTQGGGRQALGAGGWQKSHRKDLSKYMTTFLSVVQPTFVSSSFWYVKIKSYICRGNPFNSSINKKKSKPVPTEADEGSSVEFISQTWAAEVGETLHHHQHPLSWLVVTTDLEPPWWFAEQEKVRQCGSGTESRARALRADQGLYMRN